MRMTLNNKHFQVSYETRPNNKFKFENNLIKLKIQVVLCTDQGTWFHILNALFCKFLIMSSNNKRNEYIVKFIDKLYIKDI